LIVDLKKDVTEDIMIIEGLIDGVKKKITLADEKDKKEGTKD
jgi:hypothetical protein